MSKIVEDYKSGKLDPKTVKWDELSSEDRDALTEAIGESMKDFKLDLGNGLGTNTKSNVKRKKDNKPLIYGLACGALVIGGVFAYAMVF